jgi:hypothetical protein
MGRRVANVPFSLPVHELACRYRQPESHALLSTESQDRIYSVWSRLSHASSVLMDAQTYRIAAGTSLVVRSFTISTSKDFQALCYREPAMPTRRPGRLMLSTVAFLSHVK